MTATEQIEQEARFQAQVTMAVAKAIAAVREHVREDDLCWRDVHYVATEAAVTVLKAAIEGDAELNALRIERDSTLR